MSLKRKLLVIGGSYMNIQMKTDPESQNGTIVSGGEYRYHPYGDSAVTAIAAAKLGCECAFSTRFGDDINGRRLYEYYKDCGISKHLMRKDCAAQTGLCLTLYNDLEAPLSYLSSGASLRFARVEIDEALSTSPDLFLAPLEEIGYEERTVMVPAEQQPLEIHEDIEEALMADQMIETSDQPSEMPEDEDIKMQEGALEDADEENASDTDKVISSETVSSYIRQESLALYAVQKAEQQELDILLQYTPFTEKYPLESMQHIKMLVISDEMLYSLTGFFPDNTEKTLRALIALSKRVKAKYYIVQQGDDSVFVYDGNRYEIVKAPSVLCSDTREIGAKMKQTFIGALAAEYLESKNIVRACRLAIVVSLLTRAKFGNLEKMMSRAELEQYAAEHGIDLYR